MLPDKERFAIQTNSLLKVEYTMVTCQKKDQAYRDPEREKSNNQ
jgi:hypothetical protein